MSARFGARLRRLRLAATPPPGQRGFGPRLPRRILPATRLARMAGLSESLVTLLESGLRAPSRGVVLRLADALGCSAHERALLLADAGFWPWADADERTTELLVGLGLAVAAGDYRRLEQSVRETSAMGVR